VGGRTAKRGSSATKGVLVSGAERGELMGEMEAGSGAAMGDGELVWVCEGEAMCSQGKMTGPRGKWGGLGREREVLMREGDD
jgi:hypothetical protein